MPSLMIDMDGAVSTSQSITAGTLTSSNICYSDGTNCTVTPSNPFNQTLNTTDNVTFANVTADFYIGDGSLLTGISSGGNPFDQSLNTTDNVTFHNVTLTGGGLVEEGFGALTGNPANLGGITRGFAVAANLGANAIATSGDLRVLSSEVTWSPTASSKTGSGYFAAMVSGTGSSDITGLYGMNAIVIPTSALGYSGEVGIAAAIDATVSNFGSNITENAYGIRTGLVGGFEETYGIYIFNVQGLAPSEIAAIMDESPSDAGWHLRQDNKKLYWGAAEDMEMYWDGTDGIINTTTGSLHILNESGFGVIDAHDFVTHTFNESIDNPLEQFTEDTTVYDVYSEVADLSNYTLVVDKIMYCSSDNDTVTVLGLGATQQCYPTEEDIPLAAKSYYHEKEFYEKEYETKTVKGTSQGQLLADLQGFATDLNNNVDLYENLTDFNSGLMVEDLYTQSRVIDNTTNYYDEFTREKLDDKSRHKNVRILDDPNIPVERRAVLSVEDRIVDLEGVILAMKQRIINLQNQNSALQNNYNLLDARVAALERVR